MKKVIAILALAALVRCTAKTTEGGADSTKLDSTKVDSTKTDSVKVDSIKKDSVK